MVRRATGVVAQGSGVDIQATGRENVRLQGHMYGVRGSSLEQRVDELLQRFGLAEAASSPVVGSSRNSTRGSWTSAIAMSRRRCMPPE
jgi:ABC-2 type transport system ATP-binding protein